MTRGCSRSGNLVLNFGGNVSVVNGVLSLDELRRDWLFQLVGTFGTWNESSGSRVPDRVDVLRGHKAESVI